MLTVNQHRAVILYHQEQLKRFVRFAQQTCFFNPLYSSRNHSTIYMKNHHTQHLPIRRTNFKQRKSANQHLEF